MKDVRINGLLAAIIIGFIALGCTCNDDSTDNTPAEEQKQETGIPKAYWGEWTGEDDSQVAIRADGSGDYRSGGTQVTGGTVTLDEAAATISIKFLGIGKTLKIDVPPQGNKMTLSGVVYTRKGGGTAEPQTVPADAELQALAKKTLLDFDSALQKKDFTEFHGTLSKPFQKQVAPEKLGEVFKDFIKVKATFKSVAEMDANFTDSPKVVDTEGYETLILVGYYPTTPRRTKFELKYIFEEGSWKLIGLRINTKD